MDAIQAAASWPPSRDGINPYRPADLRRLAREAVRLYRGAKVIDWCVRVHDRGATLWVRYRFPDGVTDDTTVAL